MEFQFFRNNLLLPIVVLFLQGCTSTQEKWPLKLEKHPIADHSMGRVVFFRTRDGDSSREVDVLIDRKSVHKLSAGTAIFVNTPSGARNLYLETASPLRRARFPLPPVHNPEGIDTASLTLDIEPGEVVFIEVKSLSSCYEVGDLCVGFAVTPAELSAQLLEENLLVAGYQWFPKGSNPGSVTTHYSSSMPGQEE